MSSSTKRVHVRRTIYRHGWCPETRSKKFATPVWGGYVDGFLMTIALDAGQARRDAIAKAISLGWDKMPAPQSLCGIFARPGQ